MKLHFTKSQLTKPYLAKPHLNLSRFHFPRTFALFLIASSWLTSCGYRVAPSMDTQNTKSVSLSFVNGDISGDLTSSVVTALSQQPGFEYIADGGMYRLEVTLLDQDQEKIGYRFQNKKNVAGDHKIIPSEGRGMALAEVRLIENSTNKITLGPAFILGTAEFDHQNNSLDNNIQRFSLGQLTDIDTTEDVLYVPLYRNLSEKIATWLQSSFDGINSQR